MVARSITLLASWISRRIVALACLGVIASASGTGWAEQFIAYKLEVSNSYIGLAGEAPRSGTVFGGGGSVLQQWIEASRPYVRISNVSTNPAVNLFGAQLDLSQSGSMVTACEWVQGAGGPDQTWNWNNGLASAFFQFHKPLGPGESVLMRLSTAPRPGMEELYKQNQTLFHPAIGNCVDTTLNFASIDVFSQPIGSTTPVTFQPSGEPAAPDLVVGTTPLDRPLTPQQLNDPSSVVITPVPVPEPDTIMLAASAAAILAVGIRRTNRRVARAA